MAYQLKLEKIIVVQILLPNTTVYEYKQTTKKLLENILKLYLNKGYFIYHLKLFLVLIKYITIPMHMQMSKIKSITIAIKIYWNWNS